MPLASPSVVSQLHVLTDINAHISSNDETYPTQCVQINSKASTLLSVNSSVVAIYKESPYQNFKTNLFNQLMLFTVCVCFTAYLRLNARICLVLMPYITFQYFFVNIAPVDTVIAVLVLATNLLMQNCLNLS